MYMMCAYIWKYIHIWIYTHSVYKCTHMNIDIHICYIWPMRLLEIIALLADLLNFRQ